MNFWDEQFSEPGYRYGTAPNRFLIYQSPTLRPRSRILLPGDGEGRNGVWLAQQGHEVFSVDCSSVGLNKARRLAQEKGVTLRTEIVDLAGWTPPAGAFDALVLTYVHLPANIRADAHRRLVRALRPGGILIMEAFHPQQLQHSSGGPKESAMLYSLKLLRADLAELMQEILGWEGETALKEGPGHQGVAHVTRYVGRRR